MYILQTLIFDIEKTIEAKKLPEYRKQSLNMVALELALKEALARVNDEDQIINLTLCTGEGELDETIEFYENSAVKNRLRPNHFKNSLHNSTLGYITLKFPNIKYGMTISNGDESFERGLELAQLDAEIHPEVLQVIVAMDIYGEKVYPLKKEIYGDHLELKSGISIMVLSSLKPSDGNIKYLKSSNENNTDENYSGDYYPADGQEKFIVQVLDRKKKVEILKTNGKKYTFEIEYV